MKKFFKKIIIFIITWQAKLVLARYHPKVIAITGSVGKTTTKDAIFTVLSKFKKVRKSEKSFNSEIGVPLTILGVPNAWSNIYDWIMNIIEGFSLILFKNPYPEYLVLEVGVGKPGDIKYVAPWLRPDVVVVTAFPDKPVHVEFFSNVEHIIEEKSSLVEHMRKDGTLILNHDDSKVYALHSKFNIKTISYGTNENATYRATHPMYVYKYKNGRKILNGINFKLEHAGNTFPVNLPYALGMHFVGQALASIAVASVFDCDLLKSINYISEFTPPPGRLNLIEGINDSIIIDDSYNSSPAALYAGLEVLKNMDSDRKIAVLGDMLELGKFTEEAHRSAGESLVGIADVLVTVGPRAKSIVIGATKKGLSEGSIYSFDNAYQASDFLKSFIKRGDAIFVKGSQGVRLERVVASLMLHPELKNKLLARQEKEWQER